MATVVYGEFNEGDDRKFLDINALAPGLPALTDGAQLQATVVDVGTTAKAIIIVVPVPAGPQTAPAPSAS